MHVVNEGGESFYSQGRAVIRSAHDYHLPHCSALGHFNMNNDSITEVLFS